MAPAILQGVLLLIGCLMLADAGLLGTTECTYGPSYWCGSLRNAKQCSAVTHCIQTVWDQQQLPADNDDICKICTDMVQQARDVLQSNQTQEELKQVLEGSCRLIPLREVADECIELADEFIPELIETLASQMNPQVVCATAGLCNSVRIDMLLREHGMLPAPAPDTATADKPVTAVQQVSAADYQDCADCHKYVDDVVRLVREHSKEELMDHLLAICGELGSVSDGCSALVAVNIDDIYNFLANQVNADEACTLFGMCGDLFSYLPKPASPNTGDEACDFCVVIAQHWRDVMTSNTTEEEFKEILDGLCEQSGHFKGECLALVDSYYMAAYKYLMQQFDPKKMCVVVGICSATTDKAIWTTLHTGAAPASSLLVEGGDPTNNVIDLSSMHMVGRDEANSYRVGHGPEVFPRAGLTPSIKISVAGESGLLARGDQACTMCQFTLHFIQQELGDKATRTEIENAVKSVCDQLPQDLREQCDDYVDAYGDQVIALLQQEIDPSVLCPLLGLCPSSCVGGNCLGTQAAAPVKTDVTCIACEYILVQVKELLANKTNEEAIRDALDRVCSVLPHSISTECQSFIDNNAIEVMQLLAGGVDPEQVCRTLGLCSDNMGGLPPLDGSNQLPLSRLFVSMPPAPAAPSSLETTGQSKVCVLCEFVINVLEKMVLDNNTHVQEDIQKAADAVCLYLPTTLQEDCIGFMDQYSKAVVELLINNLHPKMVCGALRVCKRATHFGVSHSVAKRSVVTDTRQCLICEAVVTTHQGGGGGSSSSSSGGDSSLHAAAVAEVCNPLTGDEQTLCTTIQHRVASLTIDAHTTSTATCASISYCTAPSNLIGSSKCTWGPSYWCKRATPFCREKVWATAAPAK